MFGVLNRTFVLICHQGAPEELAIELVVGMTPTHNARIGEEIT